MPQRRVRTRTHRVGLLGPGHVPPQRPRRRGQAAGVTRFITVTQAAEEYFVPERTVRTWIARGLVTWVGTGLLDDDDVMRAEHSTRRTRRMGDLLARAG